MSARRLVLARTMSWTPCPCRGRGSRPLRPPYSRRVLRPTQAHGDGPAPRASQGQPARTSVHRPVRPGHGTAPAGCAGEPTPPASPGPAGHETQHDQPYRPHETETRAHYRDSAPPDRRAHLVRRRTPLRGRTTCAILVQSAQPHTTMAPSDPTLARPLQSLTPACGEPMSTTSGLEPTTTLRDESRRRTAADAVRCRADVPGTGGRADEAAHVTEADSRPV